MRPWTLVPTTFLPTVEGNHEYRSHSNAIAPLHRRPQGDRMCRGLGDGGAAGPDGALPSPRSPPVQWRGPSADLPTPPRPAQRLGGFFLGRAGLSFAVGWPSTGWILAALVALLAAVNLFAGVCVGCAIYYWLGALDRAW